MVAWKGQLSVLMHEQRPLWSSEWSRSVHMTVEVVTIENCAFHVVKLWLPLVLTGSCEAGLNWITIVVPVSVVKIDNSSVGCHLWRVGGKLKEVVFPFINMTYCIN